MGLSRSVGFHQPFSNTCFPVMETEIVSKTASKAKAPYKRRMTEKRKLQNRAAQAIYREKQKIRIAELERIAALRLNSDVIAEVTATSLAKDLDETADETVGGGTVEQPSSESSEQSKTATFNNEQRGCNETDSLSDLNFHISESYNTFLEHPISPIDRDWSAALGLDPTQTFSQFTLPQPRIPHVTESAVAAKGANHNVASPDLGSFADLRQSLSLPSGFTDKMPSMPNLPPRSTGAELSLAHINPESSLSPMQWSDALLPTSSAGIGGQTKSTQYGLLWESLRYVIQLDVVEDAQSLLSIAMETNRNLASVFLYGIDNMSDHRPMNLGDIFVRGLQAIRGGTSPELSSQFSASGLADPYTNNLQMLRASTLDAYICNAREVGLVEEDFYHEVWRSPFYRADITSPHDIKAFQATFRGKIAPHLLPMPEQIMHQHHPFLDVLPFPSMRSRAVSLLSFSPPLLDLVDFKRDISRDGLICWHADKKGYGNPRDMRSWETAPWFLKKWWLLLGGKEGEAWEQTKWWREFRGESMSSIFRDQ